MNLLIEYFISSNEMRNKEYLFCIEENIKNPIIKNILLFISDDSIYETTNPKIKIVKLENRPSFLYLFNYCNSNFPNEINIISNTDIIFDETLSNINVNNINNTLLTLTRWDLYMEDNTWKAKFFNHVASQDCWIFKTPIKIDNRTNFLLGKPGCDNRIAQIFLENGFLVKNPGLQIITKHMHVSNHRTYNQTDIVSGPYLLLQPNDDINSDTINKTIPHY